MTFKISRIYTSISNSDFIRNSFWGLAGRMLETLFLSVFFVIISRNYSTTNFANFLIATNIYQLVVGFSSMGLGDWFIRELEHEKNKNDLINKFFKIQAGLGISFYLLNLALAFILYNDGSIRLVSIVLGTNIIFDNIIYAIKSLNIARSLQKKSAIIMAIDGFLKLTLSCLLFLHPFSIFILALLLVAARLLTVNLFMRIGSPLKLNIVSLWKFKLLKADIKQHVFSNWRFVVIVGLSLMFWRSATIIISKFLTLSDVANYEVAFKIFSIFMVIPVIASTTIYPKFIKYSATNNQEAIRQFYKIFFIGYTVLSLTSYAFIQSFADDIIPLVFGNKFSHAGLCLKEMFLTFLVFPSALLQANLLVALKMEKVDMYFNMIALVIYLAGCFTGLYFFESLSVINYSIFGAFLIFHILQNALLTRLKLTTMSNFVIFYSVLVSFAWGYNFLAARYNPGLVFASFFVVLLLIGFVTLKKFIPVFFCG